MADFPAYTTIVITDASCLIILDKIDLLHLLPQLFTYILTTAEIAQEFRKPMPTWVILRAVNNKALQESLSQIVDAGEASAIALAEEVACDYLLTDDRAARKLAEQRGIIVKGSAGLLLYAKSMGVIPFISPYIEKIQQTNFRISQKLIDRLLHDAGE